MTTIYAVTSGEYSDYGINHLFSTKEKAESWIHRQTGGYGNEYRIEEYELDTVAPDKESCWRIAFRSGSADVSSMWLDGEAKNDTRVHVGSSGGKVVIVYVTADTPERAVKVAMERRSVALANDMEAIRE